MKYCRPYTLLARITKSYVGEHLVDACFYLFIYPMRHPKHDHNFLHFAHLCRHFVDELFGYILFRDSFCTALYGINTN